MGELKDIGKGRRRSYGFDTWGSGYELWYTGASGRTTKTMSARGGFWSAKTKIIKIEGFVGIGGNIHAI
jgi:hypothetical protein